MTLRIGGDGPAFAGLSTRKAPYLIGPSAEKPTKAFAQDLRNVTVRDGTLSKREGFERINRTAGGAPSPGLGIFRYARKTGTRHRVVKFGASFYLLNVSTGALTLLKSGAANSTRHARAVVFRDTLLIADYDEWFVYDGVSGKFGPANHAAPAAPTVVAGSGSLPNGTYRYVTVPYSSYLSEEGPASAPTSYTVTGSTAPNVTPTYTADEIWNQVRVYRTVAGGSTFLFHSTRSAPFSAFNDTTADASLGSALASTTRVQITDISDIADRNDRIFFIRKNDPLLYYTISGKRTETESSATLAALNNFEVPVALARTLNSLIVLGEKSIQVLFGDRAENYSLARVESNAGCMARASVRVFEDVVYFLGNRKVYAFDGINPPVDISTDDILPTIRDDIDWTKMDAVHADIDVANREYLLTYRRTGSYNDRVLRYRIDTKEWYQDDDVVSCFGELDNASDTPTLFHSDDMGYCYERRKNHFHAGLSVGTLSGTATGGSTTTLIDSGADFDTTADGLVGLFVEITHATGVRETTRITSNTGTQLTFAAISTAVAPGATYVICPMRAWWTSKRFGSKTNNRWKHIEVHFEEQTHEEPLQLKAAADSDSNFTTLASISMNGKNYGEAWVGKYGRRLAVRVELGGSSKSFSVAELYVDAEEQEN